MSEPFNPADQKASLKDVKDEAKQQAKTQGKALGKQIKDLVKNLPPEKLDLLLKRLTKAAEDVQDRPAELIARAVTDGAEVPLSFAQEREWFRYRLFPGIAHNISGALQLEGRLSTDALSATFDAIVRRHEILRVTFSAPQGVPVQTVHPPSDVSIRIVDALKPEWRGLYEEEVLRPFDIGRDLLLRVTLIRLGDERHVLLVTMHHIVADGWSIGVLTREIAELYPAFVEGRQPNLHDLPIQYGDFASWQRLKLDGGALDDGLAYWRTQLADLPPVLELPPDAVWHDEFDPSERDHDGAARTATVSPLLRRELEELSRREGTTLFVTMLSAFMVLLMRCTGRTDLLIGSPVSGRSRVETEGLIGLFLNTLALRANLSPDMTFVDAMAIVRKAVLEGLDHAGVPVERVVQDLDIKRSSTVNPLYETIFNFTPGAKRLLDLPGLRARVDDPPALIEEFSTQLFVTELEGVLELDLRYRRKRYSEARMAAFLEQYVSLLHEAVKSPERHLGAFDLATASSRLVLPDPTVPLRIPEQQPAAQTIAAWIARTPEGIAISQGGESLNYAQFGERIAAVAGRLHLRGLQRGDVVAVSGPKSPDLIAAMAGTFLAGGVLLTLSPDLPEQRRALMLKEAGARFVIEGDELTERADARNFGGDAAYVFFTSGSTGTPKAVLGTHAGLAHWLRWQRETFGIGPGDRSGQLTGLSFDVVLRDVFLPLTSGATLVLPSESDGTDLLGWLERERISIIHTVPAIVETWLLSRPAGVTLHALRHIFAAGEPLTSSLVSRWREAFREAGEIVNLYGPTETTLAKCFYRVPSRLRAGVQPLGNTLPQTQALVLTPRRALCGIGEPGEIAIRTPFRSLGYVNAPEENAKRFIANPFRDDPSDVLYLTGDRGAYDADGVLEFLGRVDDQVKVRGVRIEPMEVTVTLQAHADVASCAVIARDDGEGTQLVGYVVLKQDVTESSARLQEFLAQRLPAAMVPAAWVFLDTLPLTANHKLDRSRLPAPARVRPNLESRYVAPRDAIELRLVQIWEDLLDVRPIGVTDRFFEIGGHSLLALRLLVEVEQRLGRKVPLPALFEEPTIEHLAAVLRQNTGDWPLMITLRAGNHPLKLFLVHPGGGTLLNYVYLVRYLPPEIPVHGIQARGLDGNHEPHETIEQMAADYLSEIRAVQAAGPYLLAGHSFGGVIAFEIARQMRQQGDTVAFLGMFDSVAPVAAIDSAPQDERRENALRLVTMAEAIGRFLGQGIDASYEELCVLSTDE